MGFHGDLLPDQQFPAQQYRAAPVLGEEPVIISAAVAQPLSQIVAGDAGQHGEVDGVHRNDRRVCRWFQKSVAAGDKLMQVRDLAGLHAARLGAQGDAEGLSSGEGIL